MRARGRRSVSIAAPLTQPTRPARVHPTLVAAFWMVGTLSSFALMAVGGRELSAELNTFQILFFRSVVGLVLISALLTRRGWAQVATRRPGMHVLRNVAHYVGQFGWFYGIALLPLAQVFAIEFTIPIWTMILAALFLGERMTAVRVAAVALGIAGTLIILRPGIVPFTLASAAVLMAAFGYAVSYIFTKKLVPTDAPLAILFYMALVQLPLGLVPSLFDWATPSPALWPWLLVVGVTALSAHFCIAKAMSLADAMVVVPIDFLRLPLIALVGFAVYAEPLDPLVFVGAVVMLAGNLINLRAEHRRR
ncbi:MAG: DMT family transporter [Burkholderiales bacterium]|nr:MAG: DMT family transporter [Burkholderiales bacterium]